MIRSPLETHVLFHIGPAPVTAPVVTTWGLMVLLAGGSWLLARRTSLRPGRVQALAELVIEGVSGQVRETIGGDPAPYLPLIATLFLFILTANWSALIPGVEPPTAHIETDAALALVVLAAAIWFGVRQLGVGGYLKSFTRPVFLLAPLNFLELLTRTFSMIVRLFGNVMSGVFIIGVILGLAGLLVPIPLMALDLLTGAVQAYIFAALACVFIGGALAESSPEQPKARS
jgi:F-type H+-transporting ATPase subunit a